MSHTPDHEISHETVPYVTTFQYMVFSQQYKEQLEVMQGRRLMSFISHNRPVGASMASVTSAARAETLFQDNNIIIFILENLQMQLT